MKRTVRVPSRERRTKALAITLRMSATVLSTPLNLSTRALVVPAMISARLVLPVPGGP